MDYYNFPRIIQNKLFETLQNHVLVIFKFFLNELFPGLENIIHKLLLQQNFLKGFFQPIISNIQSRTVGKYLTQNFERVVSKVLSSKHKVLLCSINWPQILVTSELCHSRTGVIISLCGHCNVCQQILNRRRLVTENVLHTLKLFTDM